MSKKPKDPTAAAQPLVDVTFKLPANLAGVLAQAAALERLTVPQAAAQASAAWIAAIFAEHGVANPIASDPRSQARAVRSNAVDVAFRSSSPLPNEFVETFTIHLPRQISRWLRVHAEEHGQTPEQHIAECATDTTASLVQDGLWNASTAPEWKELAAAQNLPAGCAAPLVAVPMTHEDLDYLIENEEDFLHNSVAGLEELHGAELADAAEGGAKEEAVHRSVALLRSLLAAAQAADERRAA